MRQERAEALQVFKDCIEMAKATHKNIKRLEAEEAGENIGFDIIEKSLPDVQALERTLDEVRRMWGDLPLYDPDAWVEDANGEPQIPDTDGDIVPTERDLHYQEYLKERAALLADLDAQYGYIEQPFRL